MRKGGKVWGEDLTPGPVLQIVQQYARAMGLGPRQFANPSNAFSFPRLFCSSVHTAR